VTAPDPAQRLRGVLAELTQYMDEMDARGPHTILVTDPETGARYITGSFQNRLEARVAAMLLRARQTEEDPDLGGLVYEALPYDPGDFPARPSGT
jgi:hypothetical protein